MAVGNKHGSFLRINVANCGMGGGGSIEDIYGISADFYEQKTSLGTLLCVIIHTNNKERGANSMKTHKQTKERKRMYMEKFREMLSVIEEECVNKNQDYKTAAELCLNWDEKYLQSIFKFITDTSLREYIHRRRLTEAYKK